MGHFFGFGFHSNAYTCLEPAGDIQNCASEEYGDWYDVMGNGAYSYGLNALLRFRLGWLGADELVLVEESTRVTIHPLHAAGLSPRAAVILPTMNSASPVFVEWRDGSGLGDEKMPEYNT